MIPHPFQQFLPHANRLSIWMLTKEDGVTSDRLCGDKTSIRNTASLKQVHGGRTVVIRESTDSEIEADGMITDQSGLLLITKWGDCQNFVIYAPDHEVVGVLHAGWKGVNTNAIEGFFAVLMDEFGIAASDVLVGAGPSLCTDCAGFTDPANELTNVDPAFFHGRNVDLQGIADRQLRDAGVQGKNIERSRECTRCHPEKYWTYRGGDKDAMKMGYRNVVCTALVGK